MLQLFFIRIRFLILPIVPMRLQDVNPLGIEIQVCLLPYLVYPAVYRIVIRNLNLHVPHHDLIILIGSHKGGQGDSAFQKPLLRQGCPLGPDNQHGVIPRSRLCKIVDRKLLSHKTCRVSLAGNCR